jgi:signal transduction histidine kinase
MNYIKKVYAHAKEFCIAYPAILSGTFIYLYLFYCILQYFLKVKEMTLFRSHVLTNILDSFDAFPFMWLLSVALVKVIEIRTQLHKTEEQKMNIERERELQQSQLKTLQEVTRGVQHHINNPLAIISLSLGPIRKSVAQNPEIMHHVSAIEESVNRITTVMSDFSKVREYAVESAGTVVGDIASPKAQQ